MTTTEENSPTAATAIPTIRRRLRFDAVFLAIVLTVFSVVTLATLSDYGITWDVYEYHIGDKFFYFFTSLDSDFLDFSRDNIRIYDQDDHPNFFLHSQYSRDNPYQVWPVGVTTSSLSKYALFTLLRLMDPFDAHHAILVVYVGVLVLFLY